MFIIYINDLSRVLKHCRSLLYADDTVVYCGHQNPKIIRKLMQEDLGRIQKWCNDNRLSLNVKKTKIMTFMSDHRRKILPNLKFYMNGAHLEEVDDYTYLGVEIDNCLNGQAQYNKLRKTLGFKLHTFGKIRKFLNTKAALTLYKSTVLPINDYNDHFQYMWNVDKLDKLQKTQNWWLRIVYGSVLHDLSEDALHDAARLNLLKKRRILHILSLMYHRSKKKVYLDDRDINTRQFDKVKFKVTASMIKKAFKTVNYLGAQLWDKLPLSTQLSGSFIEFKRKVLKHITEGLFLPN